ncbi:hypothetical protein [Stigmatella hybrida]|uniref:hypothetical protein n=1 Tax=Stigmatella hybrida TaxID=394097 RepID=UPI001CDA9E33|nr:hypothetical protein [Stigmatella hybrida]
MRFAPHLFLPVVGAVLLVAAVVATALWPEAPVPEVGVSSAPRPSLPQAPPPAPLPRPAPKPVAVRPPPVEAPPPAVAEVPAPPRAEPPFQAPVEPPRREAASEAQERVVSKPWMGRTMERVAQRLGEDQVRLERERQEAQMRGDTAEVERLEKRIELNRKRIGVMRTKFPGSFEQGSAPAPLQ